MVKYFKIFSCVIENFVILSQEIFCDETIKQAKRINQSKSMN